ncbi:patatin-like phospholipase family protein [Candidatus Omnitrophota bacterium]
MEKIAHDHKVISIYSDSTIEAKSEYAINLTVALANVTKAKVMLINMNRACDDIMKALELGRDSDVLILDRIEKQRLSQIRRDYQYVVIDLPIKLDESTYQAFSYSDTVHFFVSSTKDDLESGHSFLEGLLKKDMKQTHDKMKVVINRLNIFDRFSIEEMSWLLKRNVWAMVPESSIIEAVIDSKGTPIVLRSHDSEYSRAVVRIAKSETDRLLGLALGSGAAFGLAHIGVLKVLEENHVPIDVLSGSSIGGLMAALWGLGFSSDKIEYIAKKLRKKLNIMRLLDFTVPISGILAGKRLRIFLKSILREKRFEDLQIPVKIMVYDLANRETIAIEKGLLAEAVYKSVSVPGIFKPSIEKNRIIVDGGVSAPVPVDALLKQGVRKIIAVNVLPGPKDIYERNILLKRKNQEEENLMRVAPFYVKIILRIKRFFKKLFTANIFDIIMTSMQSIEYVLAESSCKKASVALRPVFSDATSVDFHLVKDFIKKGKEEANLHIKEIKELAFR